MHLTADEISRLIMRLRLIYSCCRLAARANAGTGSGGGEILSVAIVEEDKEEEEAEEVRRGRGETAGKTFQRERASLGSAGNSVLLLPAAAAHQMAAAIEDTPQNGSREETAVVATVEPSGGAQQASKAASNGHQAPSPQPQPGGTQRKNLDCFNFTGRQPAPVMTKIGSRDPMVKKMVYNQYRDMLRKYSNASTSP